MRAAAIRRKWLMERYLAWKFFTHKPFIVKHLRRFFAAKAIVAVWSKNTGLNPSYTKLIGHPHPYPPSAL